MQKKERRTSEDVQITKELTVSGLSVTGFLGSKYSTKNAQTGKIDGGEYGIHVSQTFSSWPSEEAAIRHTAEMTADAYYLLREAHQAKKEAVIQEAKNAAAAKEAAAKLAAREEAESQNVTTSPNV